MLNFTKNSIRNAFFSPAPRGRICCLWKFFLGITIHSFTPCCWTVARQTSSSLWENILLAAQCTVSRRALWPEVWNTVCQKGHGLKLCVLKGWTLTYMSIVLIWHSCRKQHPYEEHKGYTSLYLWSLPRFHKTCVTSSESWGCPLDSTTAPKGLRLVSPMRYLTLALCVDF